MKKTTNASQHSIGLDGVAKAGVCLDSALGYAKADLRQALTYLDELNGTEELQDFEEHVAAAASATNLALAWMDEMAVVSLDALADQQA